MRRLMLLMISAAVLAMVATSALSAQRASAQPTDYLPGTGGSGASYTQLVSADDSERFWASDNWGVSSWNFMRYGESYRYAEPNTTTSDAAYYRFDIPERGSYDVYVWYPSDAGYNTSTPIGVVTTDGIEWTFVDQTQRGGQAVYLGSFEMEAGDNWNVLVSRWTAGEGLVIADSINVIGR